MSRQTPKRRQNHTRQPSGPRIAQASDYESDAAHYLENHPPAPKHFHRTNTELNLGVLKRYVPSITTIIAIAANAVIYTFLTETQGWERSGVEGTLFVCSQEPSPATGEPRFCLFILNRRGLNNIMVDLATVQECDITSGELTIMHVESNEVGEDDKIVGVWMHADSEDTRQVNMNIIHGLWEQAKEARKQAQNLHVSDLHDNINHPSHLDREQSVGPAVQVMGKSLSIAQLFASQGGGGGGSLGGIGG
jgi:hypothetical protein